LLLGLGGYNVGGGTIRQGGANELERGFLREKKRVIADWEVYLRKKRLKSLNSSVRHEGNGKPDNRKEGKRRTPFRGKRVEK